MEIKEIRERKPDIFSIRDRITGKILWESICLQFNTTRNLKRERLIINSVIKSENQEMIAICSRLHYYKMSIERLTERLKKLNMLKNSPTVGAIIHLRYRKNNPEGETMFWNNLNAKIGKIKEKLELKHSGYFAVIEHLKSRLQYYP